VNPCTKLGNCLHSTGADPGADAVLAAAVAAAAAAPGGSGVVGKGTAVKTAWHMSMSRVLTHICAWAPVHAQKEGVCMVVEYDSHSGACVVASDGVPASA